MTPEQTADFITQLQHDLNIAITQKNVFRERAKVLAKESENIGIERDTYLRQRDECKGEMNKLAFDINALEKQKSEQLALESTLKQDLQERYDEAQKEKQQLTEKLDSVKSKLEQETINHLRVEQQHVEDEAAQRKEALKYKE